MTPDPLQETVARACAGDASAVEELVAAVEHGIYGLAVRMLWHPEDAKDATQEILIRIVTHLSSYRGESRFTSWCFAIAVNYLRSARKSRVESAGYTFESFEAELHEPVPADEQLRGDPEYDAAVEEVKVGCTLGMLTCLGREERLAWILGEILELDHNEAAAVMGVNPAAFRQRLSRARKALVSFTSRVCGIVNPESACRCDARVPYAVANGRVKPGASLFGEMADHRRVKEEIARLDELRRAAALYRTHPNFRAPEEVMRAVRALLDCRA